MGQASSAEARATLNRGENNIDQEDASADDFAGQMVTAEIARLNQCAIDLSSRYEHLGETDDLNEAILLGRKALSLSPPGHPDCLQLSENLAVYLSSRYKQLRGIDDLNEVIILDRKALSLRPPGHPDRSWLLSNLAIRLSSRHNQFGGIDDLNEAIVLDREALSLHPPGHPDRSQSLNNLAICLSSRYNQLGGIDDLNEAIILDREVLSLRPPGHPDRSGSLNNLAVHLSSRYSQLGEVDGLNEAIVLDREALSLRPPGHPDRSQSLNNLANCLSSRYKQLGKIDDLNEAIVLNREALSLRPPGHPDHSQSLNNLANCLSSRYERLWGIDDLNEAIVLDREALSLCSPRHPDRSHLLNNLAMCLSSRYKELRGIDDLNEAIFLDHEALSLRPPGHPDRSGSLNNLAVHLSSRYNQLGGIDGLNEAIVLNREALSLRPPGHPDRSQSLSNLANCLSSRYKQFGEIDNLNEAIVLSCEALSLRPPGHPRRSWSLERLGAHLCARLERLRDTDDHNEAMQVEQELFALYTQLVHVPLATSVNDLSAARAWVNTAETFNHPTTIIAYETALRLLVENAATLPPLPQHLALLKSISSSLGVDAFSACIRNRSTSKAVELLEQGRSVFWSQLTRLRSPLDNIITSGPKGKALADEFMGLTSIIRTSLQSSGADQHDRICGLNHELKKVVSKIRGLSGQSRFLLPYLFSDLQRAATDGPVIIVNASKYGCDALIVFANKNPIHIPLSVTKEDVQRLTSKLRHLTRLSKRMDVLSVSRGFKFFLRELWDDVVSPIIDALQTACPLLSRIWWCPTAEFSLLPLHAAAPYGKGQRGVQDLYISSYATTLTALIHARRPSLSASATMKKHFIAIGQAQAPGSDKLPSVGTELANIGKLVNGLTTFMCIEGQESCIANVVNKLGENEWVHFACHGIPNEGRPFESGFALHDGRLTVQRIIQCDLQNPEFAYLSACHTTVGDKESPDENIHLASAMQFAGFRSVIGTMWAVDDAGTNDVTSMFYELMKDESGRLDYTLAARALRMAVKKADIPIDQRILYIHLGA